MSGNGHGDFNVIAPGSDREGRMIGDGVDLLARTMIWQTAALEIPNEREVIQWPVEGDDAARVTRLVELTGDLAAAVGRGHADVFDELAKLIAAATIWMEALAQR